MQYLDPRSPNPGKILARPAIGQLSGKTIAYLNNGWNSMARLGRLVEGPLKDRYGVARVLFYDFPRTHAPEAGFLENIAGGCDAAIVGMAN